MNCLQLEWKLRRYKESVEWLMIEVREASNNGWLELKLWKQVLCDLKRELLLDSENLFIQSFLPEWMQLEHRHKS